MSGSELTSRIPSLEGIASDKDRVNALFAPFRPREANPEHYDRKLKFWSKAVEEYGSCCGKISFTIKELQEEFRIDGKSPACLSDVVDQVYRYGTIVTERDFFQNLKAAEGWKAWSQTSDYKVMRKVGSYVPSPISYFYRPAEEEVRFINTERLKALTDTVSKDSSILNKLLNSSTWKEKICELTKVTDPLDLDYLLRYLKATKRVATDKIGSEDVLLRSPVGTQSKITAVEKGKYDIMRTKEILEKQLNDITDKAQQAEDRARASLKQGRRNTAKHELRRKKLLEQRMDKLLTMVDNLTVLGMQIEDAESDTVMISAYEAGKKALAGVLEDKRMNADRVTEAMLDIEDLLDEHADISAALSQPINNQDAGIDELENELEELMREDEEKSKMISPPQPSPEVKPAKFTVEDDNDEQEAIKLLKELDLDGLEDFSNNMSASQASQS